MSTVIGVDVGGTTIKAGRFSPDGRLLARTDRPTPSGSDLAFAVRDVAAGLATEDTVSAGIVVPGVIDRSAGVVRWSANLGWSDVPLRSLVESDLGVPVVLEHDVTAAALAEHRATGGDLLYLGLGTGIGAAYVVDGSVMQGASGSANEIGHIPVRSDGEPCVCGQLGCLETYASAASVARRYVALGGDPGSSAADVVAAQGTDPSARRVWEDAADALGTALAIATLLLDPARIVLGGGLAGAGEVLVRPVAEVLTRRLTWRSAPPLSVSTLGPDAGIHGAALLAARLAARAVAS